MPREEPITVTETEFHRNVDHYQNVARTKPVTITKRGRRKSVLLSAEEYERLKRRDRRVVTPDDLTDEEVEAIRKAKVPARYNYLNKLLKDWKP